LRELKGRRVERLKRLARIHFRNKQTAAVEKILLLLFVLVKVPQVIELK
jgi:hypothetical protein